MECCLGQPKTRTTTLVDHYFPELGSENRVTVAHDDIGSSGEAGGRATPDFPHPHIGRILLSCEMQGNRATTPPSSLFYRVLALLSARVSGRTCQSLPLPLPLPKFGNASVTIRPPPLILFLKMKSAKILRKGIRTESTNFFKVSSRNQAGS